MNTILATRLLRVNMVLPPVVAILSLLEQFKKEGLEFAPITIPVPENAPADVPRLILTLNNKIGRIVITGEGIDLDFEKQFWDEQKPFVLLKLIWEKCAQDCKINRFIYVLQDKIQIENPAQVIYTHLQLTNLKSSAANLDHLAVIYRERMNLKDVFTLKTTEIISDWDKIIKDTDIPPNIIRFRETFAPRIEPQLKDIEEIVNIINNQFETDKQKYVWLCQ